MPFRYETKHGMEPTTTESPARRLADALIPEFDAYVLNLRDSGESWRAIATHLRQYTGGVLDVSHQTLHRWFER